MSLFILFHSHIIDLVTRKPTSDKTRTAVSQTESDEEADYEYVDEYEDYEEYDDYEDEEDYYE